MEERTRTLLCGDLFTQGGADHPAVTESDILGRWSGHTVPGHAISNTFKFLFRKGRGKQRSVPGCGDEPVVMDLATSRVGRSLLLRGSSPGLIEAWG